MQREALVTISQLIWMTDCISKSSRDLAVHDIAQADRRALTEFLSGQIGRKASVPRAGRIVSLKALIRSSQPLSPSQVDNLKARISASPRGVAMHVFGPACGGSGGRAIVISDPAPLSAFIGDPPQSRRQERSSSSVPTEQSPSSAPPRTGLLARLIAWFWHLRGAGR